MAAVNSMDMNVKLTQFSQQIIASFDEIPRDRKKSLDKLKEYIQEKLLLGQSCHLMFICTHNSRRSHFGQILSALAAEYYQIPFIQTFSAGTEITAFHPNAIAALQTIGVEVHNQDRSLNPHYLIAFSSSRSFECFSKRIEDEVNPKHHFAAIMTCTHAEQNCPYVAGADFRIALPYDDPKEFDGTEMESAMYLARVEQIATEMYYIFSQLKR